MTHGRREQSPQTPLRRSGSAACQAQARRLTNVAKDTSVDRVLVGRDFVYWGGEGPRLPDDLDVCCATQGHRCHFPHETVAAFVQWIEGVGERGLRGRPGQWPTA